MHSPEAPPGPSRLARVRRRIWPYRQTVVLLGAGLLAGLIIATLLHDPPARPGLAIDPAAGTAAAPGSALPAAPAASGAVAAPDAHAQPGEIVIPQIAVRSSFVHLGLNSDGTLQVPARYDVVGWYAGGPAPGDAGGPPAVLAGHVDSKSGPGVFFRLHELKVGGEFVIGGTDGLERHFRIYKTVTYRKNAFPAKQVYARSPNAEVRLITCTGTFDEGSGHYADNLVVYATLIGA